MPEKSGSKSDDEVEDEEEEEDNEDEDEEEREKRLLYDAKEFEDLAVSADVRQVFSYIGLYTPHVVPLELKLQPFIPDFIAAVGDVDAFIKVSERRIQKSKRSH